MIYRFDVTISTHDLLKAGVTEARLWGSPEHHHRVVVDNEAALTAAQMVSCHGICTGVYDRI